MQQAGKPTSAAASCQASLISQRPVAALMAMVSVLSAAAAAALAESAGRHYGPGRGPGQADELGACCGECCSGVSRVWAASGALVFP